MGNNPGINEKNKHIINGYKLEKNSKRIDKENDLTIWEAIRDNIKYKLTITNFKSDIWFHEQFDYELLKKKRQRIAINQENIIKFDLFSSNNQTYQCIEKIES